MTSLNPDHLDWHGDVETYYSDKLSACTQPGADLTIANGDSELLRDRAAQLGPRVKWVHAGDDPAASWMAPLGLLGAHNRRNALIARACLRALGVPEADDPGALRAAAAGFAPLANRLQVIGKIGGVTFVDDSLSTNVLPTLAAMDAFPGRRVALIAGGHDRGIDYQPLAAYLATRDAPTLVLAVPDSGPRSRRRSRRRDRPRSTWWPATTWRWRCSGDSGGRSPTGWSCCPRRRRASAASATTGTGARRSPAPCAPARAETPDRRAWLLSSDQNPCGNGAYHQPRIITASSLMPRSRTWPL